MCVSSFRMSDVYRLPCSICQDSLLIPTLKVWQQQQHVHSYPYSVSFSHSAAMKILLNISFARKCYRDFRKPSLQRTPDFPLHLQFSGKLPMPYSSQPNQFFFKNCWRPCLSLLSAHSCESERLLKHEARYNTPCCLKMLHGKRFLDITIPHYKHSKRSNITLRILKIHLTRSCVHINPCWTILTREDTWDQNHCFTQQLKSVLSSCNLNFQNFHTHGFRIGAASTAASLGFLELQIQTVGKWHSNAFKKCIRIPTLQLKSMP